MRRPDLLRRLHDPNHRWDVVVIGGGATGAGIAWDAATRGYSVALLERGDFGEGTSSRSTKLIHGGVRYLRQGNLPLVREALAERDLLRRLAPGLVSALDIVIPAHRPLDKAFFGTGLWLYDRLASGGAFAPSRVLSRAETLALLPGARPEGLRGGVLYQDGQFDDARLLLAVLRAAAAAGAVPLNHAGVERLLEENGRVTGVVARDRRSGEAFDLRARAVINATGPWAGAFMGGDARHPAPRLAPSQGAHVVLPLDFLGPATGLLVPRTPDGRVLFLLPWKGRLLCGTTDTPLPSVPDHPDALDAEVDFILETAGRYLARAPTRADGLARFAGVRPLVKAGGGPTSGMSREHVVHVSPNGVISVVGGKWTTFRRMAADAVDRMESTLGLPRRACVTAESPLGGDEPAPGGARLHPDFPDTEAEARWFIRNTLAATADDVLFRRLRLGFLDARAAAAARPVVERLLAEEPRV